MNYTCILKRGLYLPLKTFTGGSFSCIAFEPFKIKNSLWTLLGPIRVKEK